MVRSTFSVFTCLLALRLTYVAAAPFVWVGAVNSTSFTVHADIEKDISAVVISTSSEFEGNLPSFDPNAVDAAIGEVDIYGRLRQFTFTDLNPSTMYYVGGRRGSDNVSELIASVRTFPLEGSMSDVTFFLSSCQFRSSWDSSFLDIHEKIRQSVETNPTEPVIMLHMGDIAYADIKENDISLFESSIREVVTRSAVHSVFSTTPIVYMFDDHDYGANNADADSPSREAAIANYQAMVPFYTPATENEVYHAFTVGQVRVIVTDLRSHERKADNTTMGAAQREWFLNELASAEQYSVVVWMSTKPWIGGSDLSEDTWKGFPSERELISNRIAELKVSNLVFVAGDAHMVAADDGSHSDYSSVNTSNGAGFPVFQSSPLANVGTSKGGPYSEGCYAYRFYLNRQYGKLRISDVGDENGPCIEFSGFDEGQSTPFLNFSKCSIISAVKGTGGQASSCSLPWFPVWVWVLISLAIAWAIALVVTLLLLWCVLRKEKKEKERKKREEEAEGKSEELEEPQASTTRSPSKLHNH